MAALFRRTGGTAHPAKHEEEQQLSMEEQQPSMEENKRSRCSIYSKTVWIFRQSHLQLPLSIRARGVNLRKADERFLDFPLQHYCT